MNESQSSGKVPSTPPESGEINVDVFGRTDVGLVREHNEDNFLVADLTHGHRSIKPEVRQHTVGPKGSLFVVCDGMGGAAAGEVASRIAVDTIYELMQKADDPHDDKELARCLDAAITEAGQRIFTAAKIDRQQRGMGTTVTAAILAGPRLIIGQVGDSRAYILRHGRLNQVTKDQSLVQQLIDAKQLSEEEARNFERSNIILQALGTSEDVHVDVTSVVLRANDVLVMCSDGLSGLVEPEEITAVIAGLTDPMEACKRLTDLACQAGGHDNITVIISRFTGQGLIEPGEDEMPTYIRFHHAEITETTVRSPMLTPAPGELTTEDLEEPEPEDDAFQLQPDEEEFASHLEAAQGADAPVSVAVDEVDTPPSRSRAGLWASAAAAVLVIGAVTAYLMTRGPSSPAGAETTAEAPHVVPAQNGSESSDGKRAIAATTSPPEAKAPALAPTPAEAITGQGKRRAKPSPAVSDDTPPDITVASAGTASPPTAAGTADDRKINVEEAQLTDDIADAATETDPKMRRSRKPKKKKKSSGSKEDPGKTSKKQPAKDPSKKKKGKAKGKTKPVELDDNPF